MLADLHTCMHQAGVKLAGLVPQQQNLCVFDSSQKYVNPSHCVTLGLLS